MEVEVDTEHQRHQDERHLYERVAEQADTASLLAWWPRIRDVAVPKPGTCLLGGPGGRRGRLEISSLLVWWARVREVAVPKPRTLVAWAGWHALAGLLDGKPLPEDVRVLVEAPAAHLGYPLFLRTDFASCKHEWGRTCYVESLANLWRNLYRVDGKGVYDLACEAIVLRQCVSLVHSFVPSGACRWRGSSTLHCTPGKGAATGAKEAKEPRGTGRVGEALRGRYNPCGGRGVGLTDSETWFALSGEDVEVAEFCLNGRKWLYVAFFCQQALEKALKGLVHQTGTVPPPIHNLLRLASEAGVLESLSDEHRSLVRVLTAYYIEARYPGYKERLRRLSSEAEARAFLEQTKEMIVWLRGFLRAPERTR